MYPQSMFRAKISIFIAEKSLCILHGQVFVMTDISMLRNRAIAKPKSSMLKLVRNAEDRFVHYVLLFEPRHENTRFMPMRKQRCRSTSQ